MLIAGLSASQLQPDGTSRAGMVLYRPMTKYANRMVLSNNRITAKTMKSGVGSQIPDLRCGCGQLSIWRGGSGGATPNNVENRGGRSLFSEYSASSMSTSSCGVSGCLPLPLMSGKDGPAS